jgi:hypothetical protein
MNSVAAAARRQRHSPRKNNCELMRIKVMPPDSWQRSPMNEQTVMEPFSTALAPLKSDKPCRYPVKKAAIADARAPSASLPLRFIAAGMLSLFIGVGWLVVRPDVLVTYHYNQYVIALTHLFVLGWICSVVMGAMYQLVPVALETKLFSPRLARWHFALHVIGVAGMVAMFWQWNMKQVGHFGSVFGFGVLLFVYNIGRTLARIPKWNVVALGVASALFWLLLTMFAGLVLASAKCWPISPFHPVAQMHAHAHLGGLGVFVMMIVAVSYKLVPMFTLSEIQNARRAKWSVALLNAGVALVFVTVLLRSAWKLASALLVIAALALYAAEMIAILRSRKRCTLDWALKYFFTAIGVLIPLSAIAVVLCWPTLPATAFTAQLENVYGFLAFMGLVTLALIGMLYKIIPFLVWYSSYSKAIGRSKVPSLADLYSARLQAVGYWLFVTALITGSVTISLGTQAGVQWSCAHLAAGLVAFALTMGKVLLHLFRPKLEPLTSPAALIPAVRFIEH